MNSKEFLEFSFKLSYFSPATMLSMHGLGKKKIKRISAVSSFQGCRTPFLKAERLQ